MNGSGGASAQETYDELVAEHLTRPGVSLGRALQNDVLKVNDKIFAFLKDGRLVVKLPAARASAMVASGEATVFHSGGRPMREWVSVPLAPAGVWRELMAEASGYVDGLGTRPGTRKRRAGSR
jgi:hypothetical protein